MKYVLPVMFILIIAYALFKKVRPYDAFVSGAGQAIPFAIKLFQCCDTQKARIFDDHLVIFYDIQKCTN